MNVGDERLIGVGPRKNEKKNSSQGVYRIFTVKKE